jgi:hypothetical protein
MKKFIYIFGDSFADDRYHHDSGYIREENKLLWSYRLRDNYSVINEAAWGSSALRCYSKLLGTIEYAKNKNIDLKNNICIFLFGATQSRIPLTGLDENYEFLLPELAKDKISFIKNLDTSILNQPGMEKINQFSQLHDKYHKFAQRYIDEIMFNPIHAYYGLSMFHSVALLGSVFEKMLLIPIFNEPWYTEKKYLIDIHTPNNVTITDFTMMDIVTLQPDAPGDKHSKKQTANHLTLDNNQRILELITSYIDDNIIPSKNLL